MNAVLEVTEVHHRYGAAAALTAVDLRVAPGECVALTETVCELVRGAAVRAGGSAAAAGPAWRRSCRRTIWRSWPWLS